MKFGVKLTVYDGQPFDMWVYDANGRAEGTFEEMVPIRDKYKEQNPKGIYEILKIDD